MTISRAFEFLPATYTSRTFEPNRKSASHVYFHAACGGEVSCSGRPRMVFARGQAFLVPILSPR